MTAGGSGRFAGLGFDPVPGGVDAVLAASDRCADAARAAASAARALDDDPAAWWGGGAATRFAEGRRALPGDLATARDSLDGAARALDAWAATLRAHGDEAERLDQRARELRERLAVADDDVRRAAHTLDLALGSAVRAAHGAHAAAVLRREQLDGDLRSVLDAARELERDHASAARDAAERLRAFGPDGPAVDGEPGAADDLDAVFAGIVGTLGSFADHAGELAATLLGGTPAGDVAAGAAGRVAQALGRR